MRLPIISDTTRTVTVVTAAEFHGDADLPGYVIVVRCPVHGISGLPGYYETRAEAEAGIHEIFAA
jgi:hypothetical protein